MPFAPEALEPDESAAPAVEPALPDPCASEDDPPPPHPVNNPPKINDPATTSVHERTPVLITATPRPKTPFQMRLVRRNASRRTETGFTQARNCLEHSRPQIGRRPDEIAFVGHPDESFLLAIPATPLS